MTNYLLNTTKLGLKDKTDYRKSNDEFGRLEVESDNLEHPEAMPQDKKA